MAREYRFRLPQIPCSIVEAISLSFMVLQDKVINQAKFKNIGGYIREAGTGRLGELFYRSRCSLITFLALGLVEASTLLS